MRAKGTVRPAREEEVRSLLVHERALVCAPSANPLPGQDAKSAECARLSDSSEGTHMMTSLTTAGSINERSSSPLSSLQQIVRSLLCWSHLAAAA